jgi:hypothetical protein
MAPRWFVVPAYSPRQRCGLRTRSSSRTPKLLLSFRIWSFRAFPTKSAALPLCSSGWMVASGGWHVGVSVVEGCQTNLLLLLVLHTLVLHPSFLVVQSEKGDRTMTSDAESVCCVSGEGIDMECVLWQRSWSSTTSISHGRKEDGENEETTKNEVKNLAPTLTAQPTSWNEQ